MAEPSKTAPPDAFGRAARDYEHGRPEWPPDAVEAVARELGVRPEATVLDLAAGTGKLTRVLARLFARVVAVEPDDAMRAVLEELLPAVQTQSGTAEAIPLADASVDAVFVGEAFHWFDGDRALAELARVLRPSGGLALLWNEQTGDVEPPLPAAAERLVQEAFARGGVPGGPRYTSGVWREPFARSRFSELHERHVEHETQVDRDTLVARVLSISSIAALPDGERRELGERLCALVPDRPYFCPMRLDVYWTRLT